MSRFFNRPNLEAEQELEDQRRQAATDAGAAPRQPFGQRRADNIMATETRQELDDIAFREGVDAGVTPGPLPRTERNAEGRAGATTNEELNRLQASGQITPDQNQQVEVTEDRRSFRPASEPEPESVETATSPAPELAPEQKRIIEDLQPAIQNAADNSVTGGDGDGTSSANPLTPEEQAESDRRARLLDDAVRRVLGLTGHKGKDALRYLAMVIEAMGSGWNGNPSQLVEKVWEEYRAKRDDALLRGQADDDRAFQREERDFAREMAQFDAMTEIQRMQFAHDLDSTMAQLQTDLGIEAFREQLGAQWDDFMRLRNAVAAAPNDWARIQQYMGGATSATQILNHMSRIAGSLAGVAAVAPKKRAVTAAATID